jgi:hypothetical protein
MYSKSGAVVAGGVPTGVLAYTGVQALWYVVVAFTLVAAGFALLRLAPRREG